MSISEHASPDLPGEDDVQNHASETRPSSKRFRFKEKGDSYQSTETDGRSSRRDRYRRHHASHHHRSKRRRTSPPVKDDPSQYDDSVRGLPPDQAFRESLFDALGDDEGAAFWEGVYGQPIHNYPRQYEDAETGKLESMDDNEYAQYVRRKMWEKSWEGIEAAKEEKRKEREQEKRRIREEENRHSSKPASAPQDSGFVFDIEFEASLKRGQQRKERKKWKSLWEDYLHRWIDLQSLATNRKQEEPNAEQVFLRNQIAWPVESGKRKDVNPAEIERFIRHGTSNADTSKSNEELLLAALKLERIRWHPDKIQHRYGFMHIDEGTMQTVTAVFQVFDRMWTELRATQ